MNTCQHYTILIIDDASCDREIYRRYLKGDQNYSYTILEAESAETGLLACRSHSVDGVLLDFLLPDANGLEFLAALKAQSRDVCPPVIMVTGQGDEAIAARAIKSGAEDYLIKRQITPDNLQVSLQSAIAHTELRRRLKQSETRFHTSVENMLDCFGIFSAIRMASGQIVDFRIEYLNTAALNDLNLTSNSIGKGLCEQFPVYYENGLFDAYCQVIETGQPLIKEAFGCSRHLLNLTTRAYDLRVSKLDDGFVASWQDVTVRLQAELMRQQHMERERIISQMTQQIRRSLNLAEILQTTVTEVRQFLNCDRVFIYQFQPGSSDQVAVEAISAPQFSIHQHVLEDNDCMPLSQPDRSGLAEVQIIPDIRTAQLTLAQVHCLEQCQIRANLEVPILQGETLWGVLVANHCRAPRQWDALDIQLLQNLASQVGIATAQANLLAQAQNAQLAAEKANRAKDELLAMVSHELRSPLTTVLGWAKLLQSRTIDPDLMQKALKSIERSTQTQTQLIEDLLDVSRIIHGTLRLEMTNVDLAYIVETTLANLRLVADAKEINLESYILHAPLVVRGDVHRLQQIITNLLTNAIKFTPEFGKVTVLLDQVQPENPHPGYQTNPAKLAQITVIDTGKGIAPNLLPHIFKQFFQAETRNSRVQEGLGLGLAIVHRLVELHHGTITASSPGEEQGATFIVYFPLLGEVAV